MRNPLERSAVYRWYRQRRGVVAFAVIVLLASGGLIWVEGIADDAEMAAEDSRDAAEANSDLICSLGELISGTPAARRPDESPREFTDRIRLLRDFARDLRDLDDCDPENPVRVRVPEEDRPALQEGRQGGGDAAGPPPGGGGGQPRGDEPPPAQPQPGQGIVDPIIDPVAPDADCELTVVIPGEDPIVVCTEPP